MRLNLMYDTTLNKFEANALKEAVGEINVVLPELKIRFHGTRDFVDERQLYCANKFMELTRSIRRGPNSYKDADDLIRIMSLRPRSPEPQIDILFTAQELAHQRGNCFMQKTYGAAMENVSAQSVAAYRALCNSTGDIYLLTKLALECEVGRLLGALKRRDHGITFCDDSDCAMGEAWTFQEMLPLAKRVDRKHMIYCPKCIEAMKAKL